MPSKVDLLTGTSLPALTRPGLRGARPNNPSPRHNPTESQNQSDTTTAEHSADFTNEALSGAHLDGIDILEEPIDDEAAPGVAESEKPSGLIDQEEFFGTFCGLFLIGYMPKPFPLPLHSLPIKPEEMASARQASDALYDIISEVHFLRFLLSPQGLWAKRIMAIGAFAVPKAISVMSEIQTKENARREAAMRDVSPPRHKRPETSSVNSAETQEL